MPSTLVPKVILTETAYSLAGGGNGALVIAIIGTANMGTANTVYRVSSSSEAVSLFGSSTAYGANLVKMISVAFAEGASVVKAISIGTPTLDSATTGANSTKAVLTANSSAGATTITVTDGTAYTAGKKVYIGTGLTYSKEEYVTVSSVTGNVVTLTAPLVFDHFIGESATIVTAKVPSDYTSAIAELLQDETKSVVVCEANDDVTASALNTMCDQSSAQYNTPCVYFRGCLASDTETTVVTKAQALNSKRTVSLYPLITDFDGNVLSGGETASAVAGAIAKNGVPKLNHNLTSISSAGGVSTRISNMDALISGGVSPIELKYGTIHIVRLVTTYAKLDGVPDTTWQEAAVRLNVDAIEKTMARRMQSKFLQSGNTPQVRLAIKAETVSILKQFESLGVLVADPVSGTPAFLDPIVSVDATNPTKVNVDIQIRPGLPLNFIGLNFKIFI